MYIRGSFASLVHRRDWPFRLQAAAGRRLHSRASMPIVGA
jgi:hypothetical protein